jgi:hypothetical protein
LAAYRAEAEKGIRHHSAMGDERTVRAAERTCRVLLRHPGAEQWKELREIAYGCANYGNHVLTELYARTKGVKGLRPYSEYRDRLSSAIRDAVDRECQGVWRRLGRKIMRGEQALATFSADRALIVRGRGVRLCRVDNGDMVVRVRLQPKDLAPATLLRIWMPALRRDPWLAGVVEKIESGVYPLTRLTFEFKRPGRKVLALLTYKRSIAESEPKYNEATLEWVDGECRLRSDGSMLSLNDAIHRLSAMKLHFMDVHRRLRRDLGKPGRYRTLRRALLKAGTFERWAEGPLHQLSRKIVDWCSSHQVGVLRWDIHRSSVDLPWARLESLVQYKGEDLGIRIVRPHCESTAQDDCRQPSEQACSALENGARGGWSDDGIQG